MRLQGSNSQRKILIKTRQPLDKVHVLVDNLSDQKAERKCSHLLCDVRGGDLTSPAYNQNAPEKNFTDWNENKSFLKL